MLTSHGIRETNRQESSQGSERGYGNDSPCSSGVDNPIMVSHIVTGQSSLGYSGTCSTRGQTSTNHVAYLEQTFKTEGLSAGSSKFHLSSRRSKSANSYDLMFQKRVSWCQEHSVECGSYFWSY